MKKIACAALAAIGLLAAATVASANVGVQGQGEKKVQQLGVYALNPQPEPPMGSKKATKTKIKKKAKKPSKQAPASAPKNE